MFYSRLVFILTEYRISILTFLTICDTTAKLSKSSSLLTVIAL